MDPISLNPSFILMHVYASKATPVLLHIKFWTNYSDLERSATTGQLLSTYNFQQYSHDSVDTHIQKSY